MGVPDALLPRARVVARDTEQDKFKKGERTPVAAMARYMSQYKVVRLAFEGFSRAVF